jgi:hypothetical protein
LVIDAASLISDAVGEVHDDEAIFAGARGKQVVHVLAVPIEEPVVRLPLQYLTLFESTENII